MASPQSPAPAPGSQDLLGSMPLVDGHNDLAWQLEKRFGNRLEAIDLRVDQTGLDPPLHTDLARLVRGGVGAQFWSIYRSSEVTGPRALHGLIEQVDVVREMIARYPGHLALARTADDIERIHRDGRIASLLGVEGGQLLDNSLAALRLAASLGVRYVTLTHAASTDWCDSATDAPRHGGLAALGLLFLAEMNRLGVLVDLSHVSVRAMHAALDAAKAPVIFSHSSARALTDHPRNVPDEVLGRMPGNGGLVMVTFVPAFVSQAVCDGEIAAEAERARLRARHPDEPERQARLLAEWRQANPCPRATLGDVADHVEHVRRVAGRDHVGLGSDFDGIPTTPEGLEDVSCFPALLGELQRRGWSRDDLRALAGGNLLRVLRAAEEQARDVATG